MMCPIITIRATQKKRISWPVSINDNGKYCLKSVDSCNETSELRAFNLVANKLPKMFHSIFEKEIHTPTAINTNQSLTKTIKLHTHMYLFFSLNQYQITWELGHPKLERGNNDEENHVSSTSSSYK